MIQAPPRPSSNVRINVTAGVTAAPARRIVAFCLDYLLCTWLVFSVYRTIGLVAMVHAPYAIPPQLFVIGFLLIRDSLFSGRGIGKRLMGLQVLDARTGSPCTMVQSIKRNLLLLGPFIVMMAMYRFSQVVSTPPIQSAWNVINIAGCSVIVVSVITELLLLTKSQRLADRWSNSQVIHTQQNTPGN